MAPASGSLAIGGIVIDTARWDACVAEPVDDVWDLDLDDADAMRLHGAQVARTGGDKSECPVGPSHPQWSTWQQGWSRTRSRSEQASGAMAKRTALMKAEVRRQTEHLPYLQPDPCAEVLRERRSLSGSWTAPSGGQYHIHFSINTTPFTEAMQKAAQAAAASFEECVQAVNRVFETTGTDWQGLIAGISTEPTEPTVEQRRHGSAAFCPRHGQTRGGTCMKCARGRAR